MSIASPCINVCTLDAEGRQCLGCHRTIDEIAAWGGMDDEERARVVALLPAREREAQARAAVVAPAGTTTLECSACGAVFGCGAADPEHGCWCASFPPVTPSAGRGTCLCPACLAAIATTNARVTP